METIVSVHTTGCTPREAKAVFNEVSLLLAITENVKVVGSYNFNFLSDDMDIADPQADIGDT